MTFKRIIPCLDVRDRKVVKGVRFENLQEIDEPTALAKRYADAGADELAFYDITASVEGRGLYEETLRAVAAAVSVPLVAGGGIRS
ncbi:MAG: imidazole glycerol phosphate synthase subunit HisF, partial [Clostridiales bacterium]|nr:imidazole glycerol phosphate synthase subunit HisF [Clostridiales bacterium]